MFIFNVAMSSHLQKYYILNCEKQINTSILVHKILRNIISDSDCEKKNNIVHLNGEKIQQLSSLFWVTTKFLKKFCFASCSFKKVVKKTDLTLEQQ